MDGEIFVSGKKKLHPDTCGRGLSQKCLEFIHIVFLSFLFSGPSTFYFIFFTIYKILSFFYGPSTLFSDPRHFTLDPRPLTKTQTPPQAILSSPIVVFVALNGTGGGPLLWICHC